MVCMGKRNWEAGIRKGCNENRERRRKEFGESVLQQELHDKSETQTLQTAVIELDVKKFPGLSN